MSGPTSAELASMRAEAEAYLPDTCTIQRATVTQDAMGGIVNTFATLTANVPCRLDEPTASQAVSNSEAMIGDAIGAVAQWPMHLPYDQDVTVKDRIVFGANTYEVAEVLDSSSWLISRRLMIKRIE